MGISSYVQKMKGSSHIHRAHLSWSEIIWSWIGSFLGISAVAWLSLLFFEQYDCTLLIGSLGSSAVLIYGAIRSPLAQPRNLIGGHIISAIIGVLHWSEPRMASDPPPAGAKLRFAEQARADFGICPRRPEQFAFHRTPAFP